MKNPEIFNADQGVQFTGSEFVPRLKSPESNGSESLRLADSWGVKALIVSSAEVEVGAPHGFLAGFYADGGIFLRDLNRPSEEKYGLIDLGILIPVTESRRLQTILELNAVLKNESPSEGNYTAITGALRYVSPRLSIIGGIQHRFKNEDGFDDTNRLIVQAPPGSPLPKSRPRSPQARSAGTGSPAPPRNSPPRSKWTMAGLSGSKQHFAGIERIIAERLPEQFNSDHVANGSFDTRSDDKGPEPEGVVIGRLSARTYAFMALERISGIIVFDITNPFNVCFITYFNPREFSVETCSDTTPVAEKVSFSSSEPYRPIHEVK